MAVNGAGVAASGVIMPTGEYTGRQQLLGSGGGGGGYCCWLRKDERLLLFVQTTWYAVSRFGDRRS